jgi:hypothetical protein
MTGEESDLYTLRALRHASERLRELSKRQQRLLDDWHKLDGGQQRAEVLAIKLEFDNVITPIVNWPVYAEENGLIPPGEGEDED